MTFPLKVDNFLHTENHFSKINELHQTDLIKREKNHIKHITKVETGLKVTKKSYNSRQERAWKIFIKKELALKKKYEKLQKRAENKRDRAKKKKIKTLERKQLKKELENLVSVVDKSLVETSLVDTPQDPD